MKALIERIESALDGLKIYEEGISWRSEKSKEIHSTQGYTDEYYKYKTEIYNLTKMCDSIKMFLGILFGAIGYTDLNADPQKFDHKSLTSWYKYHIDLENMRIKAEEDEKHGYYYELELQKQQQDEDYSQNELNPFI
jgi:hypothetical protein